MKVICDKVIMVKRNHIASIMRKEFETDIIPVPGMEFEDSTFKEPISITNVTCNFQDNCYWLSLPKKEAETEQDSRQEIEMMKRHGWKIVEQ